MASLARRLAPALLAGLCALNLAGCDGSSSAARLTARQAQAEPPRLWLAQSLGPTGQVTRSLEVCADQHLREGFVRAEPEVNGNACFAISPVVSKPGLYALRCEAEGQSFAVTVTSHGDLRRDFQVRYALTPLDRGRGPFIQTIRYRLAGTCPAGWKIGDQARAGHPKGKNTLS